MHAVNSVASQVPTSPFSLEHLSDGELLAGTRGLIGRSNQLLAELLAHLAEVEARGIHRLRACSSLYTYCVYELRLSEDAAFRRARAARFARQFPALLGAVARGELHLTGLLLLGPHLTEENHHEVLQRAKHRSKRELVQLVRVLDPLPDVPARVEPLGPAAGTAALRNGSWQEFVTSLAPVRELAPGERPADWVESGPAAVVPGEVSSDVADVGAREEGQPDFSAPMSNQNGAEVRSEQACPSRQRYKVQFTASEEYVELLEKAMDLLSHAIPSRALEAVHLRAMRALVQQLEKRKYATLEGRSSVPASQRQVPGSLSSATPESDTSAADSSADFPAREPSRAGTMPPSRSRTATQGREILSDAHQRANANATPHQRVHSSATPGGRVNISADPRQRVNTSADPRQRVNISADPRQRVRSIPASVRRAVLQRDGARCTYLDERGQRCRETSALEFHHLEPFARGGPSTSDNLTLRCPSHNRLAAEADFGHDVMKAYVSPNS